MSGRILGAVIGGAVLVLIVGGVAWVSGGVADLSRSIFGGGSAPSKSMEPYEIILRTAFKGAERLPAEAGPYEWRLILPRAFVNAEIGSNGTIYAARKGDGFYVFLHALIDLDTPRIKPAIFASRDALNSGFMAIELSNDGLFPPVISDDYCIRDDDYDPALMKGGSPAEWKKCDPSTPRCQVNTTLGGWDIKLIVSREIYDRPQEICAAARRFLSDHTVQRDNVR